MSQRSVQPHVSINEVACYRTERTLMGAPTPLEGGVGAPHQSSRVNEKRSGWGESSLAVCKKATIVTFKCLFHNRLSNAIKHVALVCKVTVSRVVRPERVVVGELVFFALFTFSQHGHRPVQLDDAFAVHKLFTFLI